MSKFNNYIKKDEFIGLLKDSSKFIKDWKKTNTNNFLYSGRKVLVPYFERKVRKDRVPLSTPLEIHKILDNRFQKEFGIKARSNSVFCVSDLDTAIDYGSVYYIFPKGKYEIIWSDQIDDLYTNLDDWIRYNEPDFKDFPFLIKLNSSIPEHQKYYDYLKNDFPIKKLYTKGNLKSALNSGYEIMLNCNEYVGIKWPNKELESFLKE